MLRDLVFHAASHAGQDAIVTAERSATWKALAEQAERIVQEFDRLRTQRVGVCFRALPESFAALAALDALGTDTFLLDGDTSRDALKDMAGLFRLGAILVPRETRATGPSADVHTFDGEPGSGASTVTILTSGTTGVPKAACHTWSSLSRPVRADPSQRGTRWLLTYRPNSYAGLQVILHCMVNRGTLVLAEPRTGAREVAALMLAERVECVSATPSYLRQLLLLARPETLQRITLKQLTLGGEGVDQQILDRLRRQFPAARVVHIYGTTELGRCFSVTDRRAGFPASFLSGVLPDGVELRIDQGELLVRSANAMQSYDRHSEGEWSGNEWYRTADLVEQRGDRVYFVGRKSDLINVGGNKVNPTAVEQVISEVPGVADVLVYRKKSSITGELVACDVVPAKGQDGSLLRKSLGQHCTSRLAAYQRPRLVRLVEEIPLSRSGKKKRAVP